MITFKIIYNGNKTDYVYDVQEEAVYKIADKNVPYVSAAPESKPYIVDVKDEHINYSKVFLVATEEGTNKEIYLKVKSKENLQKIIEKDPNGNGLFYTGEISVGDEHSQETKMVVNLKCKVAQNQNTISYVLGEREHWNVEKQQGRPREDFDIKFPDDMADIKAAGDSLKKLVLKDPNGFFKSVDISKNDITREGLEKEALKTGNADGMLFLKAYDEYVQSHNKDQLETRLKNIKLNDKDGSKKDEALKLEGDGSADVTVKVGTSYNHYHIFPKGTTNTPTR